MLHQFLRYGSVLLAAVVFSISAKAAELTIGARNDPNIDPHFLYLTPNVAYGNHVFGTLVLHDDNMGPIPGLAVSWIALDPTTWEFKLRKGVKFHDGSEFTAEDVKFSIWRVENVPNNPSPYRANIRTIVDVVPIDPHTVHIKTSEPNPFLAWRLGRVFIVSKKVAENATTADFRSGKATIGTGPYKFKEFVPGARYVLTRNDEYWGGKPYWDRVTFKIISNDAARAAALLAGDVDMIDFVAPPDVPHLKRAPNIEVYTGPTNRTCHLTVDMGRDPSPYVTDKQGKPLSPNPLKDLRVRQAMSKAINRDALVNIVMEGLAIKATQMVPPGFGGYNPNLKVEAYDPEGAKKLLAEAGYPDGFGLTVHSTNDRYVNDSKVAEFIGQMLARVGLAMKVVSEPKSVHFATNKPHTDKMYSVSFLCWGSGGEADALWYHYHTWDKKTGFGVYNRPGYSNPEVDRLVEKIVVTLDQDERLKQEQRAMEIVTKDLAIVPLHYNTVVVATKKGLKYNVRVDESTLAMNARPTN